MGLWNYIQNKIDGKVYTYAKSFSSTPSFSQFGDNIMKDDTVHTITNRILNEYSKLQPKHIRTVDGKQVKVTDNNINTLLQNPNVLMTTSDFMRKIAWLRETYDNAFIYPTYDLYLNERTGKIKKFYTGLYPLNPVQVDFYEDGLGIIYIDFTFKDGTHSGQLKYDDIIHWRKNFGENEYMGGDLNGCPNNSALLKYLDTNNKLIQSTFKSIESSLQINGIIKYVSLIKEEQREKDRLKFEKSLKNNESGIIALDGGSDYISIPFNGRQVSKDILKFFDDKIRNHYGVSEAIYNGDYTPEQKEAFYETVLESGIISLGQAFSRVMLTPFARNNGNTIVFFSGRIQMMSADKKVRLAELLLPVAGVNANTILSWFGEQPIDGGDEYYMSLNWVKAKEASQYQVGEQPNNSNASNSE